MIVLTEPAGEAVLPNRRHRVSTGAEEDTMTVVVGYTATAEGAAALDRAIAEAERAGEAIAVVNSAEQPRRGEQPISGEMALDALEERLRATGLDHTVRQLTADDDPAAAILDVAAEVRATMVVIGIRRRSPIGKLILGSTAQRVLLEADCPVVAVKGRPVVDPAAAG